MEQRRRRRKSKKRSTSDYLYLFAVLLFIISIALYAVTAVAFILDKTISSGIGDWAFYLLVSGIVLFICGVIAAKFGDLFKTMD